MDRKIQGTFDDIERRDYDIFGDRIGDVRILERSGYIDGRQYGLVITDEDIAYDRNFAEVVSCLRFDAEFIFIVLVV